MSRRLLPALALALSLAACKGAEERTPPRIALTHQWNAPAGASLFVQSNLGSLPESAADALMATVPTLVHQLGERCKGDPAFASPGALTIEMSLHGGVLSEITTSPEHSGAACVRAAIPEASAEAKDALAAAGDASIVLHLEHAPTEAPPPVG